MDEQERCELLEKYPLVNSYTFVIFEESAHIYYIASNSVGSKERKYEHS